VDVGLHLNFTEALGQPDLHRPLSRLILAAYSRRLDPRAIADGIARQLDAFETSFGRPPDYVDGHQHVHQLPCIREALLAALRQRYPEQHPWLRSTLPAAGSGPKAALIATLGATTLGRLARAGGYPSNRRLLGVYDFTATEEEYRRRLHSWLAAAADGDLLMCHPGDSLEPGDVIGPQRLREFAVLSHPDFPLLLQDLQLETGRGSRILAPLPA
jgi:predicted glycoside hydrolase/deacetylase ChbG (UPF0249 family)